MVHYRSASGNDVPIIEKPIARIGLIYDHCHKHKKPITVSAFVSMSHAYIRKMPVFDVLPGHTH